VLDALFGAGMRAATGDDRPELTEELALLLAGLASLELAGYLRRDGGGRYAVVP
jgi:hypothetical protein